MEKLGTRAKMTAGGIALAVVLTLGFATTSNAAETEPAPILTVKAAVGIN